MKSVLDHFKEAFGDAAAWPVDEVLEAVAAAWYEAHVRDVAEMIKLFERSDVNGDRVLSLSEFKAVMSGVDPECDDKVLAVLFQRTAGDDDELSPAQFVNSLLTRRRELTIHMQREIAANVAQGDVHRVSAIRKKHRAHRFSAAEVARATRARRREGDGDA